MLYNPHTHLSYCYTSESKNSATTTADNVTDNVKDTPTGDANNTIKDKDNTKDKDKDDTTNNASTAVKNKKPTREDILKDMLWSDNGYGARF